MKFKEIKIKKIEFINEKEKTFDIKIKDVNHYILKNGIVSHNSMDLFPKAIQKGGKAAEYSASTVVYLTIAKLTTGEEENDSKAVVGDLGQSGVVITAKSVKNRIVKPKKVKFELSHTFGTNKYCGLEYFCIPETFEQVGIAKVKKEIDKATGKITYKPGAGKWYIKHLDKTVYDKELHTEEIFTQDVLKSLEPIISKYFSYASFTEQQEMLAKMKKDFGSFDGNDEFDIDNENSDDKLFN